jgi:xylose isomerase
LDKDFKLNIEANHATLAQHTFQHDLRVARINNALGSIDANQGDALLGWDTDQFPTNLYDSTLAMYEVVKMGGFTKGGLNFDAKTRRASFEPVDLFYGHIAGMDSFARGFKVASKLVKDGAFEKFIAQRYESYTTGIGKDIVNKKVGFKELEAYTLKNGEPKLTSGRQEMLESILNKYLLETK